MRRKTKKRIFQCVGYDNCNMTFTRSEHLARHVRKHTGERPFQCEFCQKFFSRLDNLRQHKQTVHAFQTTVETPNSINVKSPLDSSSSMLSFSSNSSTSSVNGLILNNNNSTYAKIDSLGPMRNLYITEAPPMLSPNSLHRQSSIFNTTQLSGAAPQFSSFTKTPQFRSIVSNSIPPQPPISSFASYNTQVPGSNLGSLDTSSTSSLTRKRSRRLNLAGSDYRHSNDAYSSSEPNFQLKNGINENITQNNNNLINNNGYLQPYSASAPISTALFDSMSIYSEKSASNISSHSNNSNSQIFGTRDNISSQPIFQQPSNITTPKPMGSNSPVNSPFQSKFTPSQPSSPSLSNLSSNFDSLKPVNNSLSSELSFRSSFSSTSYRSGSITKQQSYEKHLPSLPMALSIEDNSPKLSAYQQAQLNETSKKLVKINNYTSHKRLSENSSSSSSWLRSVMNSPNSIHHHQYQPQNQQPNRSSLNSINSALYNSAGQNNMTSGSMLNSQMQRHDDNRRMSMKSDFSLNSSLSNGSFSRVSLALPNTEIIENSDDKPNLPSLVNDGMKMENAENERKLPGLSSLRLDKICFDSTVNKKLSIQNLLVNPAETQKEEVKTLVQLEAYQRPDNQPLQEQEEQGGSIISTVLAIDVNIVSMMENAAQNDAEANNSVEKDVMPSIVETSISSKPDVGSPGIVSPNSSHAYHGNILPPIRVYNEQTEESFLRNQMKYRNPNLPSMTSPAHAEQTYTKYLS